MPWRAWYTSNVRPWTVKTSRTWSKPSCIIRTFFTYHSSFARSWSTCIWVEYYNTCLHARFAVRSNLAFVWHRKEQPKIIYVISLSTWETIRPLKTFNIWRIQLLFVTNMTRRAIYWLIHSSKRTDIPFWARFAGSAHYFILIISNRTGVCRLIECTSRAIVSSRAFLNPVI